MRQKSNVEDWLQDLPDPHTLSSIDLLALRTLEIDSAFPEDLVLNDNKAFIYLYSSDELTSLDYLEEPHIRKLSVLPGVQLRNANCAELCREQCADFPVLHLWAGARVPISSTDAVAIILEGAEEYLLITRLSRCNAKLLGSDERKFLMKSVSTILTRVDLKPLLRLPSERQLKRATIMMIRQILVAGDGVNIVDVVRDTDVLKIFGSPRTSVNNWFCTQKMNADMNQESLRTLERDLCDKSELFPTSSNAQSRIIHTIISAMCYTLIAFNWTTKIRPISYERRPMTKAISPDDILEISGNINEESTSSGGFDDDRKENRIEPRGQGLWPEQYPIYSTALCMRLRSVRETSFDQQQLNRSLH